MSVLSSELIIIFLLLLGNGVLAMAEIAVISARNARLKQLADNGNATSHASFQSPQIKAFNGLALAIIRATGPGKITVTAKSEGLTEATVVLTGR